MAEKKAKALIATCIDFRLQDDIDKWISKNFEPETFDRVSIAGDVKDLHEVLDQVKVAHDLHHIEKVVLINHEDCGAYGEDGTYEKHTHDLRSAESKIKNTYPDLKVEIYYLHLNGEFEKIH
jgi:carbonic anhydrase